LLQTNNGFFLRQRGSDKIRFGKTPLDNTIEIYKDFLMHPNCIANLHDPHNAHHATTKSYVDRKLKQNSVAYISQLQSNVAKLVFKHRAVLMLTTTTTHTMHLQLSMLIKMDGSLH
jgi:hypothetical protein